MPFPFKCLPYGFRQRLRELSNPAEAYNLQIAVGNQLTGLQPLVPAINEDCISLYETNGVKTIEWPSDDGLKIVTNFDNIPLVDPVTKEVVFNADSDVDINYVGDDFFDHTNFTNVYINNGRYLTICTVELNLSFIKAVATRIQNVEHLVISASKSNVSIGQLFSLFPNVKDAEITFANEGWAEELLLLERQNLSLSFRISHLDQFNSVLSFEADDMEWLLEDKCSVTINYKKTLSAFHAEKKIYKLIQNTDLIVNVNYQGNSIEQKQISFKLKKKPTLYENLPMILFVSLFCVFKPRGSIKSVYSHTVSTQPQEVTISDVDEMSFEKVK